MLLLSTNSDERLLLAFLESVPEPEDIMMPWLHLQFIKISEAAMFWLWWIARVWLRWAVIDVPFVAVKKCIKIDVISVLNNGTYIKSEINPPMEFICS